MDEKMGKAADQAPAHSSAREKIANRCLLRSCPHSPVFTRPVWSKAGTSCTRHLARWPCLPASGSAQVQGESTRRHWLRVSISSQAIAGKAIPGKAVSGTAPQTLPGFSFACAKSGLPDAPDASLMHCATSAAACPQKILHGRRVFYFYSYSPACNTVTPPM